MKKKVDLFWLAESAVMIALAAVLEIIAKTFIPELPFGGQITIFSMLPVILVAWKYGVKKGLLTAFAYSLVQTALGAKAIGTLIMPSSDEYLGSVGKVILMLFFDYILAFTVLGFSSIYKKAIKNNAVSLALGTLTVIFFRYACHFVSGYILFSSWAEWFFTQDKFISWGQGIVDKYSGNALSALYSAIYNIFYIGPEMLLETIGALIIGNVPQIIKTKKQ